jgi:hypothetical protein
MKVTVNKWVRDGMNRLEGGTIDGGGGWVATSPGKW